MKSDKKKILIIEDDRVLLNNLKDLLEEEGFDVKTEYDGNTGIDSAIEWKPNLIICDIAMPKKNGYEVLQEISENSETKNTPFIFLTAKVEKHDIRKGMQLGADDYIFKPFDIDDLLNSINIRLQKSESKVNQTMALIPKTKKCFDPDDKTLMHFSSTMQLVVVRDIKYIKAKSPYVLIKVKNGKTALLRETINEWEEKLPEKLFLRIHRNTIINTDIITKIEKLSQTSYLIRLMDESEPFIISKRYSAKMKDKFL